MDTTAIENGLKTAKDGVLSLIKFIVDYIAVPIIDAGLVALLVFLIATAAQKHHAGEDYSKKVYGIVAVVIVIALVSSFPVWGWKMIGA